MSANDTGLNGGTLLASALFLGLSRRLVQKGALQISDVRMVLEEAQHGVEESLGLDDPAAKEVHQALEGMIKVLLNNPPKSPPSAS